MFVHDVTPFNNKKWGKDKMYFSIEFLILSFVCVLMIFGAIINHYKSSSKLWYDKYNELYDKYMVLYEKDKKQKEQNLRNKIKEIEERKLS